MRNSGDMSGSPGRASSGTAAEARTDLQRVALRDLVTLSEECAAAEMEIERAYQAAMESSRKQRDAALEDIEQRYQALKADIQQKYDGYLARIREQYEADLSRLNTSQQAAVERIRHDAATVEQEIQYKHGQEVWLADSVLEGARAQLVEEARQAAEGHASQLQLVNAIEEQAAFLARSYGYAWPEPGAGDAGGAAPEPQGDDVPFAASYEATERNLERLAALWTPRWSAGALPFAMTLLLCLLAAGATQIAISTTVVQWRAMLVAVGATIPLVAVAVGVLRAVAKAQVGEVCESLRRSLAAARRAADAEFAAGEKRRAERGAEAQKKRDAEVADAHRRFSPILARAVQNREGSLRAVQEERERLLPKIESQRELGLRETEDWHHRAVSDLEQGHDRELEAARRKYEAQVAEIERRHDHDFASLEQSWHEGLTCVQQPVREGQDANVRLFHGWDDPVWQTWTPPRRFSPVVRFGEFRCDLTQVTDRIPRRLRLPETFSVPALLAFPNRASLLIHADARGRGAAIRALQAVMMRLLTSMPAGQVRFTIIDPVGLGQSFAGFMHLADHDEALVGSRIWTESEHIEQRLADLTEHMETVIQKYLRNEFATIDDYNAQAGELAEPYRYLVIADFPTNLSDVAVHRLNSIASSGARCGVYTLIARDTRLPLPSGSHLDDLESHSVNLVWEDERFVWRDDVFRRFPLALDGPPSEEFLTRILHVVGRHAKESRRVEVPFTSIAPSDGKLWSRDSREDIEVPIGRMGATRLQMMRLGRGVAQHALIAGKTGSGKSTLLHVLVTNLAMWYSPDEVEFYLVDFKKGVEFKTYATHVLPHARAIAVESDREFGLSVLQRVDAELGRRGAVFRKAGVQDLPSYRQATGAAMPRILLMIDEFQEFFSEDDKLAQDAGLLLDRLVRQGRAFGIHVLLGSQTIGGTSGLARSTMGQMAVRVALQTSEADSQIILGDGNSAARLLSRPGEAIYNDAGGLVEGNSPFQVAWLPDDERENCLARVQARAAELGVRREAAVVFEGNVPADITKNRALESALNAAAPPAAAGAVRVWLGEPVAIKEPTAVVLRRQSGSNVLIVGQQEEAAMAMLAGGAIALAAQHAPDAASFHVFDGSPADSPLASVFGRIRAAIPHRMNIVEYRSAAEAMAELAEELSRRQASGQTNAPAVYVLVYGMQRYRILRKQEDAFSFSMGGEEKNPTPDRQFADLLREGPPLGMHVLAWSDTPATVERTLDRGSLREFDHRVLFQMSAADSSNLIDSPLANKLGAYRALAYSEEQGVTEKFRPYALPSAEWLDHVRAQLSRPRAERR